ncbi:hypothetical protein [Pelotomaculum propionicicum]|uniref:hypothetical protein n=1 Tax=Pelotomaculum propionicicum TaxID=258475 RepID=UPI0012917AF1|nr:hypothetical protein [Pelotomaculum propionicicum]NLI12892.1 hypothetical protein [Peptococcaceae bacterium]
MPVIIGPVIVENQTGGKFNFGVIFFTTDKNNMHLEGRCSSYNQGSFNNQSSLSNYPSILISGISTDIVDSELLEKII